MQEPQVATDTWVGEMVDVINRQSFDKEKLSTALGLLNHGYILTSSQIARIASTMTFGDSQVDFLKSAFGVCADPANYERAIEVLTFSTDREKVREYIHPR